VKTEGVEGPAAGVAVARRRGVVVTSLGVHQILAWGSSYYLLAVLAEPIARDTGWSLAWIVGALSLGLLVEGLVAPLVGDAIERHGGRPVLAASAVLLAAGLAGLALAPTLPAFVLAWLVIGLGMGAGLYDAAFSTLGRLYGMEARRLITYLTLFGGFASTICWPLSALLETELGWRGTCGVYAAIQLFFVLPLVLIALPREEHRPPKPRARPTAQSLSPDLQRDRQRRRQFMLIASSFTISSAVASVISVHLLTMLQTRGVALAAAVALGALIGPSQVGARVVEMLFGQRHHPVWAMIASSILIAVGLGALWADLPWLAAAIVVYGGGMGIRSIVRGSVPLTVFGVEGYASLMGRLAMPSLLVGAVSPFAAAVMLGRYGLETTFAALTFAAMVSVVLSILLLAELGGASTRPA
jgi:MFS family permease